MIKYFTDLVHPVILLIKPKENLNYSGKKEHSIDFKNLFSKK